MTEKDFDIYFVWYPKCGRTWSMLLMRTVFTLHHNLPINADVLNNINVPSPNIPSIKITHNGSSVYKEPVEKMVMFNSDFFGKKLIILIREPKDELVSHYFHKAIREPTIEYKDINLIAYDSMHGLPKYLKFFQMLHKDMNKASGVFLLKYEDLKKDPEKTLSRLMTFIGFKTSEQVIKNSVEYCKFENMKHMEKIGTFPFSGKLDKKERAVVREGKVGRHTQHFNQETIDYIDSQVGKFLPQFYGY